jgi:hypothetical protein
MLVRKLFSKSVGDSHRGFETGLIRRRDNLCSPLNSSDFWKRRFGVLRVLTQPFGRMKQIAHRSRRTRHAVGYQSVCCTSGVSRLSLKPSWQPSLVFCFCIVFYRGSRIDRSCLARNFGHWNASSCRVLGNQSLLPTPKTAVKQRSLRL